MSTSTIEILDWLIAGDPAIRWQVLRDLKGAPRRVWQAERERTVTMDGGLVIYGGEAVFANGQVVGRLRSGGYGYTVGKNIGFIYLPLDLAAAGTALEVEVFGVRYPAVVEADVLYDASGSKVKG